jgi:hypothetical protein
MNIVFFFIATLISLSIAVGTISVKAFKSANANPLEALRYE